MSSAIRIEHDAPSHIGRVLLARPEQGNAFTMAMVRALRDAIAAFALDDAIKVIVIGADGEHLTRGFDPDEVEAIFKTAPGGSSRKVPSQRARLHALDGLWWGPDGLYTRVLHCPKITVLAAKGLCREVGLYLSLCCDLVLASDDATFGNRRWRHIGVDGDISMLVAAVGLKRAKGMLLCGDEWSAEEALGYGLIDAVTSREGLASAVDTIATQCAQVMRDGIAAEKHIVFASLAKLQINTGFATAAAVGAWASNIHFRAGEFNFLRERRNRGTEAALQAAERHFAPPRA